MYRSSFAGKVPVGQKPSLISGAGLDSGTSTDFRYLPTYSIHCRGGLMQAASSVTSRLLVNILRVACLSGPNLSGRGINLGSGGVSPLSEHVRLRRLYYKRKKKESVSLGCHGRRRHLGFQYLERWRHEKVTHGLGGKSVLMLHFGSLLRWCQLVSRRLFTRSFFFCLFAFLFVSGSASVITDCPTRRVT